MRTFKERNDFVCAYDKAISGSESFVRSVLQSLAVSQPRLFVKIIQDCAKKVDRPEAGGEMDAEVERALMALWKQGNRVAAISLRRGLCPQETLREAKDACEAMAQRYGM